MTKILEPGWKLCAKEFYIERASCLALGVFLCKLIFFMTKSLKYAWNKQPAIWMFHIYIPSDIQIGIYLYLQTLLLIQIT